MTYGEYLIYSARMGDIEGVKECLSEDVPVNTQEEGMGNTALHMACANNFIEVARLLLEHKADINMLSKHEIQALMKMINTAMLSSNESESLDYPAFV